MINPQSSANGKTVNSRARSGTLRRNASGSNGDADYTDISEHNAPSTGRKRGKGAVTVSTEGKGGLCAKHLVTKGRVVLVSAGMAALLLSACKSSVKEASTMDDAKSVAADSRTATGDAAELRDHFPLDQGGENSIRPQTNRLHGTTSIVGKVERGRSFNGETDFIALQSFYDAPVPKITLCGWVRTSYSGALWTDNWSIIDFDRSEYFNLYVDAVTGFAGFSTRAQELHDLQGTTKINDGKWHHVCGTYDGVDKKIFVDGTMEKQENNAHRGQPLGSGVVRYGFIGDGSEALSFDGERNEFYFTGDLDDVRIYHGGLSENAVTALFQGRTGDGAELRDHFPLDEGGENRIRPQTNRLHGTTSIVGKVERGRSFNGETDFIALQSFYDAPVPKITLCGWVRTSYSGALWTDNWSIIDFDRSEYFNLYVDAVTGFAGFSTRAQELHDLQGTTKINDGKWHHVCGTYDGVDKKIFVDGTMEKQENNAHRGQPLGSGIVRYGFIGDGSEALSFDGERNEFYFDGDIDDVRIYHQGLSENAVNELFQGHTGDGAELRDHFPLDEGGENRIRPQTNRLHGTTSIVGKVEKGRSFNGETDFIALQSFYDAPVPKITLCGWVRTSYSGALWTDNWSIIDFDRSEYFNLYVDAVTGFGGFSTRAQDVHDLQGTTKINDGKWHHVCGTYDGVDKKIFVDGTMEKQENNAHGGRPLGSGVVRYGFIGEGSEALSFDGERNEFYFDGDLDDVRIYHQGLSENAVNELFQGHTGDGAELRDHFPLDEGGENRIRPQTNHLHGTTSIVGKVEKGRSFNGETDFIALQSFYDAPVPKITLCGWVRTSYSGALWTDNWSIIDFDRSEYFNLYVDAVTGFAGFSTRAQELHDLQGTTKINDGKWHHVCGTYDGVDKKIFVDGTMEKQENNAHRGQPLGSGVVRYGFIGDGSEALSFDGERNEFYFTGDIDDVRIYHQGLSENAVNELFQGHTDNTCDPQNSKECGGAECVPEACGLRCGPVDNGCEVTLNCECPSGLQCLGGLCVERNGNEENANSAPDRDKDGVPDHYESILGTDPDKFDSDGNGRSDGEEDHDGDGISNQREIKLGRSPLRGASETQTVQEPLRMSPLRFRLWPVAR